MGTEVTSHGNMDVIADRKQEGLLLGLEMLTQTQDVKKLKFAADFVQTGSKSLEGILLNDVLCTKSKSLFFSGVSVRQGSIFSFSYL